MRIYTPCSKQHKQLITPLHKEIKIKFGSLVDSTVDVRAFEGGHYPGTRSVVGGADAVVILVENHFDFIGKGSHNEYQYARSNDIPVFLMDARGFIALPTKVEQVNESDWTRYAKFTYGCRMDALEVTRILDAFGVDTLGVNKNPYNKEGVDLDSSELYMDNTAFSTGKGIMSQVENKYPEEVLLLRK